jgi:hypothetical protein
MPRKEEFARHMALWCKGNNAAARGAKMVPFKEAFALHTARRLNDAATMVARSMPRTEEIAGHMARRGNAVATRAARSSPRKEEFALHMAQWCKGSNAARRDAPIMSSNKEFARHTAQRRRERNNNAVAEVVQSLMLPPHREKWIRSLDHRRSTIPRLRPQLQSPGGNEKPTEPPALYDSPLFIWTFQTTRMKSVLGYGRHIMARLGGGSAITFRRYRHHGVFCLIEADNQGAYQNKTRIKYTRRSTLYVNEESKGSYNKSTKFMGKRYLILYP